MKKIIIIGGAGFIGTNAVNFFVKKKFDVTVVDKLTYAGNKNNIIGHINSKKILFYKKSIEDYPFIKSLLLNFKPDYILNFAAESHVDRSIADSTDFFNTNITGVYKLLEAIKDYQIQSNHKTHLIHISTDEVYGSINKGSFNELSTLNPSSPYAASKAASDMLVKGWCKTYNIDYNITNCTNNYGPYQYPEKLIPLSIYRSLNLLPIQIYGDGKNIRDWIFVEDHIKSIYLVMKKGKINNSYNISTDNEIDNNTIINSIFDNLSYFKNNGTISKFSKDIEFVKDRPAHDFRYSVDSSKINNLEGIKETRTFDKNLKFTIRWYLDNIKWTKNFLKKSNYNGERLGLK